MNPEFWYPNIGKGAGDSDVKVAPCPVGVVENTGTGEPETVEAGLDLTADPNFDPSAEGIKTDPAEDTLDPADATLDIASDFAEIADPALDSNSDLAEVADGPLDPC